MGGQHRNVEDRLSGWVVMGSAFGGMLLLATVFLIWFPWWAALLLAGNATLIISLVLLLDFFVGWGRIWKELTGR